MSYTTLVFLLFIVVSVIVYYIVPKKAQWVVLLISSLFFYLMSSGTKTIFMFATTAIVYICGLLLDKKNIEFKEKKKNLEKPERKALKAKINKHKKAYVTVGVILSLAFLGCTKYLNFFGSIVNGIGGIFSEKALVPELKILMPLGISYYTLMSISYIVDVYRGATKAEKNPCRLLLFVCYFPHILEGPFDRYAQLSAEFKAEHKFDIEEIISGGVRLLWGLFKKFVIADRAGVLVNELFDKAPLHTGISGFIAAILYTFQIYAEFSGCMDMVLGISQMFGVKMAENFKRPFFATSINDFWRRWHITLGLWLKDYVFYPVSLSKNFKNLNNFVQKHFKSEHLNAFLPAAYALFFVWFCNGIWHGPSVKYILYGLYYYVLMMLGQMFQPLSQKFFNKTKINKNSTPYHYFEIFRTFIIVVFGMLLFRANTLTQAGYIIKSMFINPNWSKLITDLTTVNNFRTWDYLILLLSFILLFVISLLQEKGHDIRADIRKQILPVRWLIYMALIVIIIVFGAYGSDYAGAAFIYGGF